MEDLQSQFYFRFGHPRWREFGKGTTERVFEGRVAKSILEECRLLDFNLHGKRILDVGCGVGELVYHFSDLADVVGIEPDTSTAILANDWLLSGSKRGAVLVAAGESIPFSDGSFDVVICHHVIEHCQDPGELMSEILRVLKVHGMAYIKAPNYDIPYEPHYRLIGLPILSQSISRLLLRWLGRDVHELNNINMQINKRCVVYWLNKNQEWYNRDWGSSSTKTTAPEGESE